MSRIESGTNTVCVNAWDLAEKGNTHKALESLDQGWDRHMVCVVSSLNQNVINNSYSVRASAQFYVHS